MTKKSKTGGSVRRWRLTSEIAGELRRRAFYPTKRVRSVEPTPNLQNLAAASLKTLISSWEGAFAEGKPVVLRGFGSFDLRTHPARIFRLPDGTVVNAAPRHDVAFAASPKLKKAVKDYDAAQRENERLADEAPDSGGGGPPSIL